MLRVPRGRHAKAVGAALLAAAAALSSASISLAATWNGQSGDDNWMTGANWIGGSAPNPGDPLTFDGPTRLNPSNNFPANTSFAGITFPSTAGAFTLSGNGIALGGDVTDSSANPQIITLGLQLTGDHTFTVATGGSLTIGAPITQDGTNRSLIKTGPGTLTLGAANTYAGPTVLDAGTLKYTADNSTAALALGASPGSATSGTLDLSAASLTAGSMTMPSSATMNLSIGGGKSLAVQGDFIMGATAASSGGSITVTGAGALAIGAPGSKLVVGVTGTLNPVFSSVAIQSLGSFAINAPGGELDVAGQGAYSLSSGLATASFYTFGTSSSVTTSTINVGTVSGASGALGFSGNGSASINADTINVGTAGGTGQFGGFGPFAIHNANGSGRATLNVGVGGSGALTVDNSNRGMLFGTVSLGVANTGAASNATGIFQLDAGTADVSQFLAGVSNGSGGSTASASILVNATSATNKGVLRVGQGGFVLGSAMPGTSASATLTLSAGVAGGVGGEADIDSDIVRGTAGGSVTSSITLDGGTLDLMGHNLGSAAAPISFTVKTGVLRNINSINGSGGVSPTGGGTLVVDGVNHWMGATTVTSTTTLIVLGSTLNTGAVNLSQLANLSGNGSVGNVTLVSGTAIRPGPSTADYAIGTLTATSLTNSGGLLRFDLTTPGASDQIVVTGAATFNGSSSITIGTFSSAGTFNLLTAGSLSGTKPTLSAPFGTRATFTLDFGVAVPNAITLNVSASLKTLTWTGTPGNGTTWDSNGASGALNWKDSSNQVESFYTLDTVRFDNSATNRNIAISGTVSPSAVVFDNDVDHPYLITGGPIAGTNTTVTKSGPGLVILATTNTYSGGTTINAGTLQVGNGGTSGSLSGGPIVNNGVLVFNRSDNIRTSVTITGTGEVRYAGAGVSPNIYNTYSGPTTIASGTYTNQGDDVNAFGTLPGGPVSILSGAAFDLNSGVGGQSFISFGQKQFFIAGSGVGGKGAIVNNSTGTASGAATSAFSFVTLTADAAVGGTVRYDIRATGTPPAATLDLAGHTLTKTGTNQISIADCAVTDGNLVVNQGALSIEGRASIPDYGTGMTITYNAPAVAQFFANTGVITRPMIFNGPVTIGNNGTSTATIGSNMILNGDVTVTGIVTIGNPSSPGTGPLILAGNVGQSAPHSLTKTGNTNLTLSGNNTYTGGTIIAGGIVLLGASDRLADTGPMTLGGGTFATGGFNETLDVLTLATSSHLDLGSGASVLHFADSHAAAWSGVLSVDNWSGDPTNGGGVDQLFFGPDATGLTSGQLAAIQFTGFPVGARMLASGEVVPVPEPAAGVLVVIGGAALVRRRRGR